MCIPIFTQNICMQTASKKVVNGWAMYDWANSSYNLVITSTIFPAYFEAIAVDNKEFQNHGHFSWKTI